MGRLREMLERLAKTFQIRHVLVRQGLAECLGTLVLVVGGEILTFLFSSYYYCYIMQNAEGFSFRGEILKNWDTE